MKDNVRVVAGVCRTGSTAFLYTLSHLPGVVGVWQPIKEGIRTPAGEPDYSIFDGTHSAHESDGAEQNVIVAKETIGPYGDKECSYALFPDLEAAKASRPLFLYRHPVDCANAWLRRFSEYNHEIPEEKRAKPSTLLSYFIQSYKHIHNTALECIKAGAPAYFLTLPHLTTSPKPVLEKICEYWDIPFSDDALHWDKNFDVDDNNPKFIMTDAQRCYSKVHMETLRTTSSLVSCCESKVLLTEAEREEIEKVLLPLYVYAQKMCEAQFPSGGCRPSAAK